VLIGADPLDIEELWRRMYMGSVYYGRRGVAMHAISGIDIALWDIKGKKLGKPVSALLGTPKRDRVRPYASLLMPATEREVTAAVERLVAMSFTAIKFGWGPLGKNEEHDVRLARAAKRAAGDAEILIDAGFGYGADAARAIRVARKFEEIGIYWLEEPFEPDEFEAYATLADAVDMRVAAGEEEATRWGFRELMERGHVDVVQPDVTRCGGLSEAVRIARNAESRGVMCVPHAWKSGVIKAASLHLNAVLETAYFQEYCVAETPINRLLTRERMPVEKGWVAVPDKPGLGVELDLDVLERYAVGPKPLPVH
jgi:L-alanine-DL-glutamate epimerase-like enolase superfamily enzyme